MAIMYPEKPREFHPASREGLMFYALEKLPQSYHVFHSLTVLNADDEGISESEIDFVIFHPEKGILCIEAKATVPYYDGKKWHYGSGKVMPHDGPYKQSEHAMYDLRDYIDHAGYEHVRRKCKFISAVWFPLVSRAEFASLDLPTEADPAITLFSDSFQDLNAEIERLFDVKLKRSNVRTTLGVKDREILLERILAPRFEIVSIASMTHMHRQVVFKSLLREQTALLNYLEEQRIAVINGLAGTGKTLVALEKARRHAAAGESVLFLCYNNQLNEHLRKCYPHDLVDSYTIDGYACHIFKTPTADYPRLQKALEEYYFNGSFPYQHIIVDEGQDFGQEKLEEIEILELLKNIIADREDDSGSFYVFYDRNQLVQGRKLPDCIQEADCRLTLYRNCRNTENIAITSMRFLGSNRNPKLFDEAVPGDTPLFFMEETEEGQLAALQQCIERFAKADCEKIVILTARTAETSLLTGRVQKDGYYCTESGQRCLFTTCRKFKGLEADAIILIDVDRTMDEARVRNRIYVGTSRARYNLAVISDLTEEDCCALLDRMEQRHTNQPKRALASAFNSRTTAADDAVTV